MSLRLRTGAATDIGLVRQTNEDSHVVEEATGIVVVADGMGGHRGGEVASAVAIETFGTAIGRGESLADAIRAANQDVYDRAHDDVALRGMGTTFTVLRLDGDTVSIGHVGDSRAYLLRDGAMRQLTEDHSLVAELVRAGELTEDEAEHDPRRAMITRAVGIDTLVDPDVSEVEVEAGDRLLACTDGLTTMLHDPDIAEILRAETDPQETAQRLVDAAKEAGGLDNVTVVVVDVITGGADTDDDNDVEQAATEDDTTGEMPLPATDDETSPDRPPRWWRRRR